MAREIVMTPAGKQRLERELERLTTVGRREVADRLRQALEMGREFAENAEYLAAKEEQAQLEQRIAALQRRLEQAQVVRRRRRRDGVVDVGVRVRLRDPDSRKTEEYEIVGSGEGDPGEGRISHASPIASALLGHEQGDVVEVDTPAGRRRLKILAVT
jgi:transcription elongation factor GreA